MDKKNSSSKSNKDFVDINKLVDKIILKNKEKMDRLHSKDFSVDTFSIKNRKGDTLYYLRKKSDKKEKDDDAEILSDKIISEARENLGEDPLEKEDSADEIDENLDEIGKIKNKKKLKFGKKPKESLEDVVDEPLTKENLVESKDFDEVVSEIDELIKDENKPTGDEDSKLIDEKITQTTETGDKEKDIAETKVAELAEEHKFFSKKEKSTDETETDWVSSSTDNLAELKKKYSGSLTITDIDSTGEDSTDKGEAELVDENIKESTESFKDTQKDDFESKDIAEDKAMDLAKKHLAEGQKEEFIGEDLGASTPKKSFFRRKKSSDKIKEKKATDAKKLKEETKFKTEEIPKSEIGKSEKEILGEKTKDAVDLEDDFSGKSVAPEITKKSFFRRKKSKDDATETIEQKPIRPRELKSKPIFRVENLPESQDIDFNEKKMLENKIKEDNTRISDLTGEQDKGEAKALKLAEAHLKGKPPESNELSTENKPKEDVKLQTGVSITDNNPDHEHVFFDEEESSSGGWTPQITEKDKKKMTIPLTGQGEIDTESLGSVGDVELPKEVLQTKSVKLSELGFSDKEWEELDFYSLYEPFAYVEILREKESLDKCYFLVEVALTEEEEKLLAFFDETMATLDVDTFEMEEKDGDQYLLEKLNQIIKEYNVEISDDSRNKIFYHMGKKSLGLGRIDPLMKDPNIEDISCDGSDVPVFLYHRKYGSLKSNIRFGDEDELSSFVFRLAQKCGKHISIAEPMLDATMPDGSRIQMTLSDEITAKGSTFTIRKFRDDPFSPPDLVEFNTMSSEMIAYMWLAVENGVNTLFAGGTASGKTTALNAISLFIPRESKIVSIEETREINLPHPNWIPGVARSGFGEVVADRVVGEIDMYDLMKAALRQRPEYILVGEIRGREAYVLFQAMATGHATYSTAHADSAQSLIHRLEGKPINIPRIMLQSLDIVCLHVITRVKNIRARRCKQIIEIIDIDPTTKEILTNEVFRWDPVEDKFIYSGKSYVLERVRAEKDFSREDMTEELKQRKNIVEWMNENNIRSFREVAKLVAQYNESPEETIKLTSKKV